MNARHEKAVATTADVVAQLRTDLRAQLDRLRGYDLVLGVLANGAQAGGPTVITPAGREARAKQDKLDRQAAHGIPTHTDHSFITGLTWLRVERGLPAGATAAPANMAAAGAAAQLRATLQHHVRRLAKAAVRTAAREVPGHHGRLPDHPFTTDGTIDDLAGHLTYLVDLWASRPGLQALLRDIDHLVDAVEDVVYGPARTPYPDPCPWCDQKTLVFRHRAPGRDEAFIRCEGRHPCRCDDPWCHCQHNPGRHRHEWVNSGRAANSIDGRSPTALVNLIARAKELAILEPRALTRLEHIAGIHGAYWLDDNDQPFPSFIYLAEDDPNAPHAERATTASGHVCVGDTDVVLNDAHTIIKGCHLDDVADPEPPIRWHAVPVCITCGDAGQSPDGHYDGAVPWPCDTYLATRFEPADPEGAAEPAQATAVVDDESSTGGQA